MPMHVCSHHTSHLRHNAWQTWSHGVHASSCARSRIHQRHDGIHNLLHTLCREVGWHASVEQHVQLAKVEGAPSQACTDLMVTMPTGQRLAVDVRVIDAPMVNSQLSHTLPSAERLKFTRYRVTHDSPSLPTGERVIPVVCRALGYMGPVTWSFWLQLCEAHARHSQTPTQLPWGQALRQARARCASRLAGVQGRVHRGLHLEPPRADQQDLPQSALSSN